MEAKVGVIVEIEIKWFSDSPYAGDRECVCSVCPEVIGVEEGPCLRLWDGEGREARFHVRCLQRCLNEGVLSLSAEEDDKMDGGGGVSDDG